MFKPIDANAALTCPAPRGAPKLAHFFCQYFKTRGFLPSCFPDAQTALAILKRSLRKIALFACALAAGGAAAAEGISAVRVWPAQDYTRITIEAQRPLRHQLLLVKHPDRLVLDLEGVDFDSVQREIAGKILPGDPYIGQLRAGRYRPGVVRLVLDLKTEVQPQIFTLEPVGEYGHRLVLDVYPLVPVDPLMALLQKKEAGGAQAESAAAAAPPAATPGTGPAAAPRPGEGRPAVARLLTVVVDAGHGGEDPGARGRRGTREKNVTLTIARKLKAIIDAEPDMRAVLTRDGDYFIPLQVRVQKARRVHADLFVSVHADAFVKPHARGSSVFALADLSLTAQINDSLKLGKAVLSELGGVNTLHKADVEQAGFAVLKAPDIPSILVETAFISNPQEERKLNDEAYQEKMARAIFKGIKSYFTNNPPLARSTLAAADRAD
jgi:N-acetylmuramoyl-L-alanine amidase